jgi:hypothetical protein
MTINDPVKIDPLRTEIDYPVLALVGGTALAVGTAVHFYQANAWWKDQRTSFKFQNDPAYALGLDKIGHFYGAYLLSHFFSAGFEAANIQAEQSALYGSLAALAFQIYVEIQDGFGAQWGFSTVDAAADMLGAAYAVGQYYVPYLKNFQPRFSYLPSEKFKSGQHKDGNIFDDYEGQKFWLSVRMKEVMPRTISRYWPSFLMLSFGIGVRNLDGSGGGQREYYIGFDFDAETIPLHGKFWQFVKNTLNYFHFPMPGVRISPDSVFLVFAY